MTAQWPAKQPVYARSKATAGSQGAVLLGNGGLKNNLVWVEMPNALVSPKPTEAANLARRKQHSDRAIPPGTPGKIRAAREAMSWTQAELAAAAGVSVRAVQAWETNEKSPTVASLRQIAEALGVDVASLL